MSCRRDSETESAGQAQDSDGAFSLYKGSLSDTGGNVTDIELVGAGGEAMDTELSTSISKVHREDGLDMSALRPALFLDNKSFYAMPSFTKSELNTFQHFNEKDLTPDLIRKEYLYSRATSEMKFYAADGLSGNLCESVTLDFDLPPWNLNFPEKFPSTIVLWDINVWKPVPLDKATRGISFPTTSFYGRDCRCSKGPNKKSHGLKVNSSPVIILGDEFIPPFLGCQGNRCPMILRSPYTGDLEDLLTFAKNVFTRKDRDFTNPPTGSVFLISANSLLLSSDTQVYFAMLFDFINKLGVHLESVYGRSYTILPLIVPFSVAFSGATVFHRLGEAIDTLRILRGELDQRNRSLLDATLDWCRPDKVPTPDQILSKLVFIPACKYSGLMKPLMTKPNRSIPTPPLSAISPSFETSCKSSSEVLFWSGLGSNLARLGVDFPDEKELSYSYAMAGRASEDRPFFTKHIAVTPISDRPVIVIGQSIAASLANDLRNVSGFRTVEFFKIKNSDLSTDSLESLRTEIVLNSQVLFEEPIVIFCGFGNSLLKAKQGHTLVAYPGNVSARDNPMHLKTQVLGIHPDEFGSRADHVFDFLCQLDYQTIIIPPMPRHFTRCCAHIDHFDSDFEGTKFVESTIIFGIFMSRSLRYASSKSGKKFFVPHLGSIFGDQIFDQRFTSADGVHPSGPNLKVFVESIADLVRCINVGVPAPYVLPRGIPANLSLSAWFPEFIRLHGSDMPKVTSKKDPRYDPPGNPGFRYPSWTGQPNYPRGGYRGRGRKRPRTNF